MPESFFMLSEGDRRDAIGVAADRLARPVDIIEKDIMVVWALDVLYTSKLGDSLSFKGGTSLSKVFSIINRFSEDIDITYDIRRLLPDLSVTDDGIPPTKG